ncbi:uncharacterized protein J8A68_003133 [[Candida] subhashii]|uniref:Sugar phosphate transporter domain-containing protein n=1 Tax=[Candida] subhashii TaxID=561895 RepID=A0A8J5QW88_9ASCO|nr:uncharacterized protein J8A68_003133 [[Candida] subhashii]KAG7663385.1 hypothetical protein J8A68_003133 [[Candida] subhashii]
MTTFTTTSTSPNSTPNNITNTTTNNTNTTTDTTTIDNKSTVTTTTTASTPISSSSSTATTIHSSLQDNNNNPNEKLSPSGQQQQQIPTTYSRFNMEAIIYIVGWYFFSLSISIYNKWMFGSGLDFKFPILITSFHQLCLCLLSSFVLYFNPKLRPRRNTQSHLHNNNEQQHQHTSELVRYYHSLKIEIMVYIKQIIPCSIASAGDIGLSNVAISLISLSLYTMLKTSSLMFVLMFGLLFKLEKFNWRLIVIVIIMTGSVIMMTKKPATGNIADYSSMGIIMVLAASLLSGLRWSFTQILLKRNPYTPNSISTIFYVAPFMCFVLFILGLIVEGWTEFINHEIWIEKGFWTTIGLLIVPGVLAFMMTLCEFKLLTVAQVITLSIAGIFKELLTICLSSVIFGDRLSLINILGLILTFFDILWYNYYRYHENEFKYQSLKEEDLELRKIQTN